MGVNVRRDILRGLAGSILLSAVTISTSFLQLRVLLHYVPLVGVGIWLIFGNFAAYVSFLDLGLTQTLGREVSFVTGQNLSEEERAGKLRDLIRSCTWAMVLLTAIVYPVGTVVGWAYLKTLIPASEQAHMLRTWIVFATSATLNLLGQGWFAGLYGTGRVFAVRILQTATVAVGFALLVVAVVMGWGLHGMAWASLAQTVISIGAALLMLCRHLGKGSDGPRVDYALLRGMLGPGLRYGATVLGGVLILQTDNLVIASTLGPAVIPDYQAVAKVITTFMTLSMMLVVTSSPFMSQAFARKDVDAIRGLLQQNQRVSLSILVLLGSCFACFADRLIHLWLGQGHFVGFAVVWISLAMMLLEAHHVAMATATMATGKIVFVAPALLAGIVNVGLSVVLAHRLGVTGVALGTLLAQLATNNWYVPFYVLRQFQIPFRRHVSTVILPIAVLLAAALATGTAVRLAAASLSDLSALVLGTASILVVGGTVVFSVVLVPADRVFLFSCLRPPRFVRSS